MKTHRSTEIALLLLACSAAPSAGKTETVRLFLERHTPDWDRLLNLASYHRLTPLLYRAFQEVSSVPGSFLSTLRQECLLITTDNLIKLREYHRVAALLDEQAIEHVAFKGIYLAEHSYPERGLRPIGDMDILVDGNDLYKAIGILATDGYQAGDKYKAYLEHPEGVIWDELHEISLFKPYFNTSRFDIDLHWRVDCLLKEIGVFELDNFRSAPDYIIENQAILLVLHHGVNNSWERIGYLNDLYFLLHQADVNWDWLLNELKKHQLEVIFFMGLYWCQQVWAFPVPATVQKQMQVYNLAALTHLREKKWEYKSLTSFRTMLVDFAGTQATFTDKLKIYGSYARSFIFRSTVVTINRNQFYIPKEWGFATVVVRAFLALLRPR
ncbi:nucleotidyltransferase family protein [Spirosoma utsteinense]|uniref:Nucleotidyltransferase family protein n=1 Tax=Spirosoma utsteinense TaxID=2585773 RepID=A0ABR6W8D0_9BACT|nr:nucleotidyltransferase family protein [Spirosoma utsteinense]MBC3784078.1 hypothetical protein [Spirosoma utsteinense]MBC3792833.1 hypothetical protein [Spirosoma utsteinense]